MGWVGGQLWAKSCQHSLWTSPKVLSATSCRVGKMWELPTCILIFIAAFLSVCLYGCLLDGNKKVFTMYRVGSKSFVGLNIDSHGSFLLFSHFSSNFLPTLKKSDIIYVSMLPWFMQRPSLVFINKSWYISYQPCTMYMNKNRSALNRCQSYISHVL